MSKLEQSFHLSLLKFVLNCSANLQASELSPSVKVRHNKEFFVRLHLDLV